MSDPKFMMIDGAPQPVAPFSHIVECDGWFFLTREGVSVGPYESRFDAELSASLLVARLSQLDGAGGAACLIQGFLGDPRNPLKRPRPRVRSARRPRTGSMATALSALQRAWSVLRASASA